jgi:predicted nucleotidyltransferase
VNTNDPNVAMLELVAGSLGDALLEQLVFVGGAIAGLLITDPAMPEIRPTQDVDAVCSVVGRSNYHELGLQLRQQGFTEDQRPGAPICRWQIGEIALDVMPTDEQILGFANRWYSLAIETANTHSLPSGRKIRLVTAPVFMATKLEAFHGRGPRDLRVSHDLEDLIAVIDGRASILQECETSPEHLKNYLSQQFSRLLNSTDFIEALPCFLPPDQASQQSSPHSRRFCLASQN